MSKKISYMNNKQILKESFFTKFMMVLGGVALWKMLKKPTKLKHLLKDPDFRQKYEKMKVSIDAAREDVNKFRVEMGLPPLKD